jgi:membrane protease subunit HflC
MNADNRYLIGGGAGILVLLLILWSGLFIVDERKRALVLQFGQVIGDPISEPGLYFKIPLIQNVAYFEDRILPLETTQLEVTPIDDRRLVVDAFARWRIVDTIRFRQAVFDEAAAIPRLERILNASLREVLGSVISDSVLSEERTELMERIRDVARGQAMALGVEIVDVRIRRADLPEQNLQATYERMQAEREREAADERARGAEAAQRVRANADRQAVELVSEARREAEVIRGEADAQRNNIFAEAYGRDPEFFAFYRSMTAYEKSLQGQNSTMVISPDSEFFNFLKNENGVPPSQ